MIATRHHQIEVASALAKKARYQGLAMERAVQSLDALPRLVDRFVRCQPLLADAMKLSIELDYALYNRLYRIVAMAENGRVVTADGKLERSANHAGYGDYLELLK